MSKAAPWSVRGGFDVREAAQAAARREGMSLSEWLSEAISNRATHAGVEVDQLREDERLEAVTQRLSELDAQSRRASEDRGQRRNSTRDYAREERPPRYAGRHEFDEDRPLSRQAISPLDAEALLDSAVERFRRQSARGERQTAEALASVARLMQANEARRDDERAALTSLSRRLNEIESHLARRRPEDNAEAFKTAIGRLETRLDAMTRRAEPAGHQAHSRGDAEPPAAGGERLDRLETKLNSILAALSSGKAEASAPSRADLRASASPRSLGEAIAEISRRQRDLETSSAADRADQPAEMPAAPSPALSPALARPASQADILALAGKIEEMRRDVLAQPAKPASDFDLDKLHGEIARMSTALHDLATRGSVAALEISIRRLAEEIEVSRRDGANETMLRPLERVVADLRRSLAEIDPRTTIAGLETQIKALDSKLDDLGRGDADAAIFHEVQQQTREIRDLLTAAAARPAPVEKIEQQVAQIARKLERQHPIAVHLGGGEDISDELRTLVGDAMQAAALEKIEERLGAVAARVEEAVRGARDARQETDRSTLEELVRGLAEKIESARAPQADLRGLERQIGELAQRLDRSTTGLSSLPDLQHVIGDLFAKLEATQRVTIEAAERAAREAAQESLREAAARGVFDAPSYRDGVPDEVSRDLAELRELQDAADRRTHSTLNAVHETLEKVVDRLAMLEDELSEVRPGATRENLAGGLSADIGTARDDARPIYPGTRGPGLAGEPRRDDHSARPPRKEDLEDFLIEPGRGFPGRGETEPPRSTDKRRKSDRRGAADAPVTDRADFIAAARRAAQAAQLESAAAAAQARPAAAAASKDPTQPNIIAQARHFITEHKRPVVLSVAAVFLLIGAYAIVRGMSHSAPADLSSETSKTQPQRHARQETPAERPDIAQAAAQFLANTRSPVPAADPRKVKPIPGSDPIVTGAISAKPKDLMPATGETTHDLSQAALLIQADVGNAKAQFELASRYIEGRGIGRDSKLAAQWYEKAAAQGLASAQYRLGSLYEKGLGVTRDLAQAKSWYEKAAAQGNVRAMHNLAVLLAEIGENGQPDYARAAQWFRKAAEYGVRDSQYNYAILLARGLGVSQNLASSYTWFAIAASQGDVDAGKKRDDVAARLGAEDLATAKAVAGGFHARTPEAAANEVQWPGSAAMEPPPKASRAKVSQL